MLINNQQEQCWQRTLRKYQLSVNESILLILLYSIQDGKLHYSEVARAARRFELSATRLFDQQLQKASKEDIQKVD